MQTYFNSMFSLKLRNGSFRVEREEGKDYVFAMLRNFHALMISIVNRVIAVFIIF